MRRMVLPLKERRKRTDLEILKMGKYFTWWVRVLPGKDTIYKELLQGFPKMKRIVLYTTRPRREGECDGVEYFFTDEEKLQQFRKQGQLIEERSYHTQYGVWSYFTADDGQIDLRQEDYLVIGTLESYRAMKEYFGAESLVPLYIEVEDGLRLTRALEREKRQSQPRYDELCRRFLADSKDFSEENLRASRDRKKDFRMWIWRSASKPLKGKLGGVTSYKIVVY